MENVIGDNETIAAISTPPGSGGIGIIRISGSDALPVLKKIFRPYRSSCSFSSHTMFYGNIHQPDDGKILDEVLAVFMQSPRSYTCEDVVEIHCHGSFLVLQNILELILSLGVSLAEPGEFTKRAYLNGRIDLTKAEAVIDILAARTRKGVDLAQEQLAGTLYRQIDVIRHSLTRMRAVLEVAIDFPDEDVDIIDHTQLLHELENEVEEPLDRLLLSADQGKIYREGISVVIVGLPNVGKSSLLNTVLQEDRALVTSIPGTTRDTIEESVDIHGMPVRIVDTAGIREHVDEVEKLGIKRAKDQINQADLILFMQDGSRSPSEADRSLLATVSHKPLILVINKIDLLESSSSPVEVIDSDYSQVYVSAKCQKGICSLKKAIFDTVTGGRDQWQEDACAPNVRHKDALLRASAACERVKEGLSLGFTTDLLAVDLQECLNQLGDIVGETTTEDILDVIFEQFCLGK
jgi:tRNA modification GTPase